MDKNASGYDSKYALDYLRNKVNLHLEHGIWYQKNFGNLTASWNASWQDRAGTYTDFSTHVLTKYEPYTLTDLRLSWQNKGYRVNCDVNNLFDVQYADFGGLTQPGRAIRASIQVSL